LIIDHFAARQPASPFPPSALYRTSPAPTVPLLNSPAIMFRISSRLSLVAAAPVRLLTLAARAQSGFAGGGRDAAPRASTSESSAREA
jgi:hypothetical protein